MRDREEGSDTETEYIKRIDDKSCIDIEDIEKKKITMSLRGGRKCQTGHALMHSLKSKHFHRSRYSHGNKNTSILSARVFFLELKRKLNLFRTRTHIPLARNVATSSKY